MTWKTLAGVALAGSLFTAPALAQKPVQQKPVAKPGAPVGVTTVPTLPPGSYLIGSDDCATPMAIAGQGTFPFDTTTATTGVEGQGEALCYAFGTSGIDNDVWFCWTPSISGNGVVETCNIAGTLDTKIAAYAGCGCPGAGTSVACNDDACGLRSRVEFAVVAGSSYMVQLGHYPGAVPGVGSVLFDVLVPPTNDDCGSPVVLPGDGIYSLDLRSASTGTEGQNETTCYAFGTSGIDSDVWYSYNALCNGDVTVTTCGLTTVDTKIAVYPGVGCPADGTSVGCNDDTCGLQSTVTWTATAGTTYTIQIGTFPGTGTNTSAGQFMIELPGCVGGPGTPICFGDGSGSPCGCGNESAPGSGAGCLNTAGVGGVLSASGVADVTADTLSLSADGVINQPGLFFQGNNAVNGGAGAVFGDGIRCCGQSVVRIQVVNPPGTTSPATALMTETATTNGPAGTINPGDTKCYQYWYRDPSGGGVCGSSFNLTNAITVTWS